MNKILLIQTSFIGDVILSTSLLEKLHQYYPTSTIDICVRKGNESLFTEHPFLHNILVWEKKQAKGKHLLLLLKQIRKEQYDMVINLQRFASSGILTAFSGATKKIGFKKNPLSFLFTERFAHEISPQGTLHEIDRNQILIANETDNQAVMPRLYPTAKDWSVASDWIKEEIFITISPASVWKTKQWPEQKWIDLINQQKEKKVFVLGGPSDAAMANRITQKSKHQNIINLAGKLSLLGSAALMKSAEMNYVNDSAPLHLCSAVNAPVTAFFCSTVPAFGFGPLSDHMVIAQTEAELNCRPCGLHGKKVCPKGHFKCGEFDWQISALQ